MMRDELELIERAEGRKCGSCRLCCKLLAVGRDDDPPGTFKKEPFLWCDHACDKGCAIYNRRPEACKQFTCVWLEGAFEDRDRPDRSQIVVSLEQDPENMIQGMDGEVLMKNEPVWCVYERTEGAARRGRAAKIVEELKGMTVQRERESPIEGPFAIGILSPSGKRYLWLPTHPWFTPCFDPGTEVL